MINNLPRLNPEQYAQQYAKENNLSVSEAKVELESQFGKPQAPQNSQGASSSDPYAGLDIFEKMDILNQYNQEDAQASEGSQQGNPIMDFFKHIFQGFGQNDNSNQENNSQTVPFNVDGSVVQQQDPDKVAQEYMENYNKENPNDTITLDEAKEILKEKYGEPQQQNK